MVDLHAGHVKRARARIEKLSLGPHDLIIVRDERDMSTFIELTRQGIGLSPYANPILLIKGGLEKATRQDLLDALRILDETAEGTGPQTDQVGRIITDLHAPIRKVQ
jgi:hypothetical protein